LRLSRRRLPQFGGAGFKRIGPPAACRCGDRALSDARSGRSRRPRGSARRAFRGRACSVVHRRPARAFCFWLRTSAAKVGPRAAVFENGMGDADELLFVTEVDDAVLVLKPNRARGLQARYAHANKFIEENAAVRVASAFWHELKATPRPSPLRYYDTTRGC